MAISIREKIELHKSINENIEGLKKSGLSLREKIKHQKEMKEAFETLKIKIELDGAEKNENLRRLIAGEYNKLSPVEFLRKIKDIIDDIDDIEPVKTPSIEYLKEHGKA